MVPGIKGGEKHGRFVRIADGLIEIDYRVEGSAGANPVVDSLANLFALLRGVAGSDVGSEGCADDFDSVGVGARDQL